MLTIGTMNVDDLIVKYKINRRDVDSSESGTSETGVDWRQRIRAGKVRINIALHGADADFTALWAILADETFSVDYTLFGVSYNGTFMIQEADEESECDGYWDADYELQEL